MQPNETLIYPPSLTEYIKSKWGELKGRTFVPDLPDDQILCEFLEKVYHASFTHEEGRPTLTKLSLLPSDFDTHFAYKIGVQQIVRFAEPRPFLMREIVRLAPVVNPVRSSILVSTAGEAGPKIVGIVYHDASWHLYRLGKNLGSPVPPHLFTVEIEGSGRLRITTGGQVIATLSFGKILELQTLDFVFSQKPLVSFFKNPIAQIQKSVSKSIGPSVWNASPDHDYPKAVYLDAITSIVSEIYKLRHGGALILLPDQVRLDQPHIKNVLAVKYRVDRMDYWKALKRFLICSFQRYRSEETNGSLARANAQARYDEHEDALKAKNDLAEFIGGLSAVDGAIVLTRRLRVLGFGAEIIANSTMTSVMESSRKEPMPREVSIEDFGTRHRSVFRLCSNLEKCVGIVVSQDGSVRVVKRTQHLVRSWAEVSPYVF